LRGRRRSVVGLKVNGADRAERDQEEEEE